VSERRTALLRQVLGSDYRTLPPALQQLHDVEDLQACLGSCRVQRGDRPISRAVGLLLSLPASSEAAEFRFTIRRDGESEIWCRDIAKHRFQTVIRPLGRNRLSEKVGPVELIFRVTAGSFGCTWTLEAGRLFGLPLPKALRPTVLAREWDEGGQVKFDVEASLPAIGPIVRYDGHLQVVPVRAGESPGEPILLFDGVCNFCNFGVNIVLSRDLAGRVRFAAMQSDPGLGLLRKLGRSEQDYDTFIVIDGAQILDKSSAALHLASYLPWPWPLFRVLLVVPRRLRDRLYDLVARNRYRLMGRRETCRIPTAEERSRFLT
jgi:predicted DCC family thiol-disulfide oxidoreductase YuxK